MSLDTLLTYCLRFTRISIEVHNLGIVVYNCNYEHIDSELLSRHIVCFWVENETLVVCVEDEEYVS